MKNENKMKNEKKIKFNLALFLIIVLALILRLVGIKHGFPFIYHPDEPTIIRSALGVRFKLNPGHFDWPHLYIYLNFVLYKVFAAFRDLAVSAGLKGTISSSFPLVWNDNLIFYYLTRCFSAIFGALTVIPLYLTGKELFGKKAGIFSALTMAILPYHVWHSHYSLGDVPMVFMLAWGLYFSSKIMKSSDIKNYLLAGLFVGLSASMKYNGGLSALMVPVAHFIRVFMPKKDSEVFVKSEILDKRGFLSLVFSGASALFGFLIGTPYALFDFKTFSRTDGPKGAFWQFTNVGSVKFMEHVGKFFTESFGRILTNTGYVVMPVYFIILGYLINRIVKKKTEERDFYLLFLYIVSLFLIWYESGFKNNRSHYYFIFYPFLALIFGFFVNCLRYKFSLGWPKENLSKLFSKVAVPICFAPLLIASISSSRAFIQQDTRNMLYDWLKKNYVSRDVIFYTDRDLKQIFDFVNARSVKGLSRYDKSGDSIIILSSQSTVEFKGVDSEFVKEEVIFDSKGRRGPDIKVYLYDDPNDTVKKGNSGGCGCGGR
jgi:hypothetical protein